MEAHELLEMYKKIDDWELTTTEAGNVAILYDDKHRKLDTVSVDDLVVEFINKLNLDVDFEIDINERVAHIYDANGKELGIISLNSLVRRYIEEVIRLLEEGS